MFDLSENLMFSVHGGGDSGGMAGLLNEFLAALEGLAGLSPAEMFAALLPGIAAMDNIHPMFVHFPIALLTLFFAIDLLASLSKKPEWRQVAGWFLYLGTVFAVMTVAAGLHAAATVAHGDDVHEIMETHEHIGITILTLAVVLSAWRLWGKAKLQGAVNHLYLMMAGLLCVLLVFAADLGGLMVYKYGVAVAAARQPVDQQVIDEHPHEHVHQH